MCRECRECDLTSVSSPASRQLFNRNRGGGLGGILAHSRRGAGTRRGRVRGRTHRCEDHTWPARMSARVVSKIHIQTSRSTLSDRLTRYHWPLRHAPGSSATVWVHGSLEQWAVRSCGPFAACACPPTHLRLNSPLDLASSRHAHFFGHATRPPLVPAPPLLPRPRQLPPHLSPPRARGQIQGHLVRPLGRPVRPRRRGVPAQVQTVRRGVAGGGGGGGGEGGRVDDRQPRSMAATAETRATFGVGRGER